jgi:hypothetical protein
MSASTRTAQQSLGTGQFWAALVVVTVALIAAAVIAFGSSGAAKPATDGASTLSVGVPPDARLPHVSSGISVGVPPDALAQKVTNGTSISGVTVGVPPDAVPPRAPAVGNGIKADLGYAPRTDDTTAGPTARRHRPQ